MEIRVKDDSVEITGYVNAIERKSKPLWSRIGQFVERICKGAFKRALERNDNVRILLNHDINRDLGGTKDGNLELTEDNIGLRVRTVITDPYVVREAHAGNLDKWGWSFGFYDREVELKNDENGFPLRDVLDLDLEEVSLLDRSCTPAYDGTLVAVRSDDKSIYYGEAFMDDIQVRSEPEETKETKETEPKQASLVEDKQINYDKFERLIEDMKK